TFGERTGTRENESASRAALFVKGFEPACASSQWFKEKETYRKNAHPSIFTVGSQLSSLVSSAPGTTKNWFPSQIWTNFITALRLAVKDGPSLAGNAYGAIPRLWYGDKTGFSVKNGWVLAIWTFCLADLALVRAPSHRT